MKFVTRKNAKVDRVACPRLISRFVDSQAEFLFVNPEDVLDVAAREGAVPFDVPGVELGHKGEFCSFDAVATKYDLSAPGLDLMARIVRGADTDAEGLEPESFGLEAMADGFRAVAGDDHERLRSSFRCTTRSTSTARGRRRTDPRRPLPTETHNGQPQHPAWQHNDNCGTDDDAQGHGRPAPVPCDRAGARRYGRRRSPPPLRAR